MVLLIFLTMIISLHIINVDNRQFQHPSSKIMMINADSDTGYINVRSAPYNAKGDGVTDDTHAFQQALNDVGNMGGGIVFAPEGNYLIASQLTFPDATVLKGVASHVQRHWGDPGSKKVFGTTLLAVADAGNENGQPFISLAGDSSGIEGLQIFYPNQVPRNPPIPYPWAIQCGQKGKVIENNYVKNVLLVNPWKGIDAATYQSPRHWFENVYGQPLSMDISVDQCYDIGKINHIHFWPFWSNDLIIRIWVEHNGISFLFQRTD
jgi:Pectate lyase superfamily protein